MSGCEAQKVRGAPHDQVQGAVHLIRHLLLRFRTLCAAEPCTFCRQDVASLHEVTGTCKNLNHVWPREQAMPVASEVIARADGERPVKSRLTGRCRLDRIGAVWFTGRLATPETPSGRSAPTPRGA